MRDGHTAAGWYPDPAGSGLIRWWDGAAWSQSTQAHPDAVGAPAAGSPFSASSAAGQFQPSSFSSSQFQADPYAASPYGQVGHQADPYGQATPQHRYVDARPWHKKNPQSAIAFGFTAIYVVLAFTAGFFLLGVIPVMAGFRAVGNKEKAGVAALATSLGVSVLLFVVRTKATA